VSAAPDGSRRGARAALVLPLGAVSLLAGLAAGLARLGWGLPEPIAGLAGVHGPLMVCGFFGTVIAFERAVALRSAWTQVAPMLLGLGGILLLTGGPAPELLFAGSLLYLAAALVLLARHRQPHLATMAVGAMCWAAGNLLWLLGRNIPDVVPWWAAFLVLTIAGERLELSRLLQPPPFARVLFGVAVAVLLAGLAATSWRVFGAGLVLLVVWLLRYDIARRTVRMAGLPRFTAVCLLSGYVWLALAGAGAALLPEPTGGFIYDAVTHAVFLGFVFAMVLGHAPIILPAVARVAVPFRRSFYAPLVLLHASLLLRVAGDLLLLDAARRWGGLGGAAAILAFLGVTAGAVFKRR
jgi:hypothetical protein